MSAIPLLFKMLRENCLCFCPFISLIVSYFIATWENSFPFLSLPSAFPLPQMGGHRCGSSIQPKNKFHLHLLNPVHLMKVACSVLCPPLSFLIWTKRRTIKKTTTATDPAHCHCKTASSHFLVHFQL